MNFTNKINTKILCMGLIFGGEAALLAQSVHYSTMSGYCVDEQLDEGCVDPCYDCGCAHRYHSEFGHDQFAENQFEESGWANRRDDELSDQLMRDYKKDDHR